MKANLRERLNRYQCFIRPKVHFTPEFSFNIQQPIAPVLSVMILQKSFYF